MPELEVFKRQPNFPKEDLSDANAAYVEYLFRHEQGSRAYASWLHPHLRSIHATGHHTLIVCGVEVDNSDAEYDAFCEGFAALEYTSNVVGQRLYSGETAIAKVGRLFINRAHMVEFDLATRFTAWQQSHPNTYGTIVNAGLEQGETLKQLQARGVGAEIAWELQVAT
ncbi:MAG: hypothetical protein ACOH18_02840 [Candidatus Saccharimonadaceae bacterium]